MISCNYDTTDPTWAAIVSQIARLERLDKFPFGAEGKRELCFALLSADSMPEATGVIDRVMESESTYECPSAPDLRRMITSEHRRGEDTAGELASMYRREDTSLPPTRKQILERHMDLIQARQKELKENPSLHRMGSDGKLIKTALRDKLAEVTEDLRRGY